jgi:hypothetical protein
LAVLRYGMGAENVWKKRDTTQNVVRMQSWCVYGFGVSATIQNYFWQASQFHEF